MAPFEQHLRTIDNLIRVKDEDRQPYTEMFDEVRTWLLREMRRVNPVFDKLFLTTCLFGSSYSNGVRLVLPTEFDILFTLRLPFKIPLIRDKDRPGFLCLSIKSALKELYKDPNHRDVATELSRLVDGKSGLLRRVKYQLWIHHIIEEAIKNQPASSRYKISYEYRAVAHKLYVTDKSDVSRKISIDVVPAISVKGSNLIGKRDLPASHYENIYAVPKAGDKKPESTHYSTFMIVNVLSERDLLWDKENLKIVYRLLKSMRDRYKMQRLKSVCLTNIFLWAVDKRLQTFWNEPITTIFSSMLKLLRGCFKCGSLTYFWMRRMNLLGMLDPNEICTFHDTINEVYKTLMAIKEKRSLTFDEVAKHFDIPVEGGIPTA